MKKSQFNKVMIGLLVFIMMFNVTVFASGNLEATGSTAATNINAGDVFIYNLTVTNNTGANVTGVTASVSGGFSIASGGNGNVGDITAGASTTKSIPLRFNGESKNLTIVVTDSGSNTALINTVINGANVEDNDNSPSDTNQDKHYASFILNIDNTPIFYSGKNKSFEIDVENVSSYAGKEVQVKVVTDDNSPFDGATNALISSKQTVNAHSEKAFTIPMATKASAKSGYYDVQFEVSFKNAYGLEKKEVKTIRVEVVNNNVLPQIVVDGIKSVNPTLVPDSNDTIQIDLRNIGTLDIKNVDVKLEGLDKNAITLLGDTANKTIKQIKAKNKTFVTYKINLNDNIKDDVVELSLKLDFYDNNGSHYTQTLPVYVNIDQGGTSLYDYGIEFTSVPNTVHPGDEFKIKFNLTNNSQTTQENLKLTVSSDGNFTFKSQPVLVVKEIAAGETQALEYTLIAAREMTSNNYPTYVTLESLQDSSETRKEFLGIYVDSEASMNSKPKIIVQDYSFGKEVILAGETFDLEMTFFNTSNSMGIQNAKVSITAEEGAFVPVNAASSFYVEKIDAKSTATHTITFKAKSDLNVKTYNITADIEYEDSKGNSYDKKDNPYKATEKMGIPVIQELRLEIQDPQYPEMSNVGMPFEVMVEFFNMGKSSLENLMVTTEGDFDVQDGRYFVGPFSPGGNDYYSATIVPMTEGDATGIIKFEFEDSVGEKHVVEKEFTFFVQPPMEYDNEEFPPYVDGSGEFPMDEEQGGLPWLWIGIGVGVVIIVVAFIVIKRKIRKKKEMALDE